MKSKLGPFLRTVLAILMGATTTMTLLGAVGTICIAWGADRYGASLASYVPLMQTYQAFVVVKLITAIAMALVVAAIIRGDRRFYIAGLVTCVIGIAVAAAQMYLASGIRHVPFLATPPTNIRFFLTVVTLLAFLLIRLPGIWNRGTWEKQTKNSDAYATPTGLVLSVTGLLMLTTRWWVGPSHMLDGYNLVDTLAMPLLLEGTMLLAVGLGFLLFRRWRIRHRLQWRAIYRGETE